MGSREALDPRFGELVPEGTVFEVLAEGFEWSEGPLWVPEAGFLLFSDVPTNAIYRWREGDGARAEVWLQPSGYTGEAERGGEPGSNGLLLDAGGDLVLCQHGDRRVARLERPEGASWDSPGSGFTTLADRFEDGRFNSPNDLVYDRAGRLYFTDPPYGLEGGTEDPGRELDFQGVYRLDPDGSVHLLSKDLSRPNGIALSPDERTLYVANSDPESALWMAWPLDENGDVGEGRVFFDATSSVGEERPGLPDGMAVDGAGNLFATGPGGVWVFAPDAAHLGTLRLPQPASNCTFGEDGTSLFVTSDAFLVRARLATRGLGYDPETESGSPET
ncbi:MAG: SMP-30/gluconolactonase/LRE family protein [Acidobacteriota bacterium]